MPSFNDSTNQKFSILMQRLSIFISFLCLSSFLTASNAWSQSDDTVYSLVEKQPAFPGGMRTFFAFLDGELKYPQEALVNNIEGRVFMEYVVEKDGSLSSFKVLKGIGSGCDEEAIRVLKNSPKWSPGKNKGREVRVKMALPIHFKIPSKTE